MCARSCGRSPHDHKQRTSHGRSRAQGETRMDTRIAGSERGESASIGPAWLVASPGRVHPSARRLVDRCYGERLLRRIPVLAFDVAQRRRLGLSASGIARGADVSGLARVAPRRRELV
jgi:hypothetical protein